MLRVLMLIAISLPAAAEWHVGGYIGAAHTQNSLLTLAQLATNVVFSGVEWEGNSFQSPLYYG